MFISSFPFPPVCVQDGEDISKLVAVEIAHEDNGDRVVSVVSELHFDSNEDFWEFEFSIAVVSAFGTCEPFETQDREMAKPFIPDDVRGLVMGVVSDSLRALLGTVQPPLIYRVTKEPGPDENALLKHHILTQVLENAGYYTVEQGTDLFGRCYWVMAI